MSNFKEKVEYKKDEGTKFGMNKTNIPQTLTERVEKLLHVITGETKTFQGEERLLKERGVQVEVLQDPICIEMMSYSIKDHPNLWKEDIGKEEAL